MPTAIDLLERANATNEFRRMFWQRYDHNLRDKGQRRGQARMNTLRLIAPDLYQIVTGTDADCFYDDSKTTAFDVEVFGHFAPVDTYR